MMLFGRLYQAIFLLFPLVLFCREIKLTDPKSDWGLFFNDIQAQFPVCVFVESGTYLGETTAKAAEYFSEVYTIEVSDVYFTQAKKKFENVPHIVVMHGDSARVLPELLNVNLRNKKVLFWLDGHFMSSMIGDQDNVLIEYGYTPIRQEIFSIIDSSIKDVIILVDDIRLLGTELNDSRIALAGNKDYPMINEMCKSLDNHGFSVVIYGDILLAYHKSNKMVFSEIVQACTKSRLYNGKNYLINEVLDAEEQIARAEGSELEVILKLYRDFSMPWRNEERIRSSQLWSNKSPHYNLWYGLILDAQQKYQDAFEQFKICIDLGYDHWRVNWYLARSAYNNGDYELASAALNNVLDFVPNFGPAFDLRLLLLEQK